TKIRSRSGRPRRPAVTDALERGPWRRARAERVALARVGCPLGCPSEGYPRRSIGEWDLDRHPVLRYDRFFEHVPCLLHQLLCTDRVASRDVTQHEAPSLGGQRYLRRFARRRMPRLL